MRTIVHDAVASADPDTLLTTGEAAALLGATRQHVVDLCERGDLPFTLVGRHRRVRWGDIESIRGGSDRLTRDQRRSLWLAHATVGKIVTDPGRAIDVARRNLDTMREQSRGETRRWLTEWERLLDGPIDRLLEAYTSRSLRGRELRQNAPFAGLLTEDERAQVLSSWRAASARP
jgi:excisionase family DNA binding protein